LVYGDHAIGRTLSNPGREDCQIAEVQRQHGDQKAERSHFEKTIHERAPHQSEVRWPGEIPAERLRLFPMQRFYVTVGRGGGWGRLALAIYWNA
jgi:hypothetical protein